MKLPPIAGIASNPGRNEVARRVIEQAGGVAIDGRSRSSLASLGENEVDLDEVRAVEGESREIRPDCPSIDDDLAVI